MLAFTFCFRLVLLKQNNYAEPALLDTFIVLRSSFRNRC